MEPRGGRRWLVVACVATVAAAFFWFGGADALNLEALKNSRDSLHELYRQRPVALLAGYFVCYVAVAALNLPGAAVLSLAGSAVFGFWPGLVVVSFASSLGATAACALSRYILRGWVRTRFGAAMDKVDQGLASQGGWYLVSLRLAPVFPFFLVNMVMGLTSMPLGRFYLLSQLGMLPGTAVFVNAGTELGRLSSLRDILSPGLMGALLLLALFPVAAKWGLRRFRRG